MKNKKIAPILIIGMMALVGCVGICSVFESSDSHADVVYDATYYVASYGNDAGAGTQADPWATLLRTSWIGVDGGNYLIYIMDDMTVTAGARYFDRSITVMSDPDAGRTVTITRGGTFATMADIQRGSYSAPMLEIEGAYGPLDPKISLTLENIILDDNYLHVAGTKFFYAPNGGSAPPADWGTASYVQDGIVSSYCRNATIVLNSGAELRNFGGMTAILAGDGSSVIMNSGSLITDIGSTNTTRQTTTSATDYRANGDAAILVTGDFFMYDGAKITNIANAMGVKLNGGSYRCFIDGEITGMKGNKGWTATDGNASATHEGRGFKSAVSFGGTTLDPFTGLPGSAIIGPNANLHHNAVKCGALGVSRSTNVSVKVYGKINDNAGQTGTSWQTVPLLGTIAIPYGANGGGIYIVNGGTVILEEGSELCRNSVMNTAYGAAASVQQSGSKLIMNGGLVSGNTTGGGMGPGIAVNKSGDCYFEMNGGIIDNGPDGVLLFNNRVTIFTETRQDSDCNGRLILKGGTVSGVTVNSLVGYGNNTPNIYRNLYIGPDVTIGTGYVAVSGKMQSASSTTNVPRQVTPITADFTIGNPNKAIYSIMRTSLPQGWTMPDTDENVIAFWIKKDGTMEFSIPAPTTGSAPTDYDRVLNVYYVAVQGTLLNGSSDMSPLTILPVTRGPGGNIIVSVPLGMYTNGATVAIVQPTTIYGTIDFDGPSDLAFDFYTTEYTIPYTAEYVMPNGFQTLLVTNMAFDASVKLYIKADLRTSLDPSSLVVNSDIFELVSVSPAIDSVTNAWIVTLKMKTGWDTTSNLNSSFEFKCKMNPLYYTDGGVLTLTGYINITESTGNIFIIPGDTVNTNMLIPSYAVTYDGNGEDSGIPPFDAGAYKPGVPVTVLGNIGIAGDNSDILVKDGYKFLGWSVNPAAVTATYIGGGTLSMPGYDVTLYAVWKADTGGGTKNHYITATSDAGSTISPSGKVSVPANDNRTFVFSAKAGYYISAVYVDGMPLTKEQIDLGSYTFYKVLSNHSISVVSGTGAGTAAITLTVDIEGGKGTPECHIGPSTQYITFARTQAIAYDSDLYVSVILGKGYKFVNWTGEVESTDIELHFLHADHDIYLVAHVETVIGGGDGGWGFINLILAVLTIIAGMAAVVAGRNRVRDDDEEKRHMPAQTLRVLALVIGIISLIVFFITEDISMPTMATDEWTVLMAVLFIAAAVIALISFRFDKGPEDND